MDDDDDGFFLVRVGDLSSLQCFDTVGRLIGRASGL